MHFTYSTAGVIKYENLRCGSDGRDKKCIQIFGTEAYCATVSCGTKEKLGGLF